MEIEKLSKILEVNTDYLNQLGEDMELITGKKDALSEILSEDKDKFEKFNNFFGLTAESKLPEVKKSLIEYVKKSEIELIEFFKKDNQKSLHANLIETAIKLNNRKNGFFIKKEKALEMLKAFPPQNILDHFGYSSVEELIEKEDLGQILSALRFVQNKEWMHKFFDEAYTGILAEDFESRNVRLLILEDKWLEMADKFSDKKFHNVSHLKEFGIIFINPNISETGELFRDFTLLLHYLNEVPFYSGLIEEYSKADNFDENLKSLLRGDVPEGDAPMNEGPIWRVVQRYLKKDDPKDSRLFEMHINPEAEHWHKAIVNFEGMKNIFPEEKKWTFPWSNFDFVGGFYKDENGEDKLVSFNLIDIIMTAVKKGEVEYNYHQQEALWNQIFIKYMGRDKMNELIEKNIINGFIKL